MTQGDEPGRDSGFPEPGVSGEVGCGHMERTTEGVAARPDNGLRVVPPVDSGQSALQLAESLTEAVANFLLDVERLASSRAERLRSTTLEDLERHRSNVNSMMTMFAERLREQEESLLLQAQVLSELSGRLGRHAEILLTLKEAQERQLDILSQSLAVLRLLGAPAGGRAAGHSPAPGL